MPDEEVLTAELVDESVSKALTTQRSELQKVPGAALFMAALQSLLTQYEEQVSTGLRGSKTFIASANAVLARKLSGDDDYRNCVALSMEAAAREKRVAEAFSVGKGFFYRFHKAIVAIEGVGTGPWSAIKARLERHAANYYLEQKEAKEKAERHLSQAGEAEKRKLEEAAQERIAMGYMEEGEQLLRQAEMSAMPVSLPEATPKVEGSRTTPKWEIKVTDLMAVIKAVAEGRVPLMHPVKLKGKKDETEERPILMVDETVLRALVDRMGKDLEKKVPGVQVKEDVKISGSGRK